MSVRVNQQSSVTVVSVTGDLTHESAPRFLQAVHAALEQGHQDFVVDLHELERLDSAGLEALTAFQRRCEEQLGIVRLCGATPTARKILEVTRLDRLFELHETLEDAVASFR